MTKYSHIISNLKHSVDFTQPVLITFNNNRCTEFIEAICDEILLQKGTPIVSQSDEKIIHKILKTGDKNIILEYVISVFNLTNRYKNFIRINTPENPFLLKDIDPEVMKYYKITKENYLLNYILKHKWVLLNYPTPAMAKLADMEYEKFYDMWLKSTGNPITEKMHNGMSNLQQILAKANHIKIVGDDTDLSFYKREIPSVICSGECNLPDGEVYTAPEKFSANGYIKFDYKTIYQDEIFDWIKLQFENGKIISFETTPDKMQQLKSIFEIDEGAKYIGEFAFGLNKEITEPICDILFDEKIAGSIHMAIGSCYDNADNGNHSAIHWDMVRSGRNTKIYFDDKLIRENGIFTIEELKDLN